MTESRVPVTGSHNRTVSLSSVEASRVRLSMGTAVKAVTRSGLFIGLPHGDLVTGSQNRIVPSVSAEASRVRSSGSSTASARSL
jgi:hypothetical protein